MSLAVCITRSGFVRIGRVVFWMFLYPAFNDPLCPGLVPWEPPHGLWNIRAGVGTHLFRGSM